MLALIGCTVIPEVPTGAVDSPDASEPRVEAPSSGTTGEDEPVAAASSESGGGAAAPLAGMSAGGPSSGSGTPASARDGGMPVSAGGGGMTAAGASGGGGPAGAGAPVLAQGLGAQCASPSACESTFCVDGHCCYLASCAACEVCGVGGTCISNGACPEANGIGCVRASTCSSGICADGYCCDRTCGACESCANPELLGSCQAIKGVEEPGECDGDRSCSSSASCLYVDEEAGFPYQVVRTIEDSLAQVITFRRAGRLEEIRLVMRCNTGPQGWLETVTQENRPSGTRVSEGTLLEQPRPRSGDYWTHVFKPAAPLSVRSGEALALVIRAPGCQLMDSTRSYSGGNMLTREPGADWLGGTALSTMFQALVSR
jgi:hypothetical protein